MACTASTIPAANYARLNIRPIDDDGFVVAESGAILLYLAEKAGRLIPADFAGRTRVVQWCFAVLNTVAAGRFLLPDAGTPARHSEQQVTLGSTAGAMGHDSGEGLAHLRRRGRIDQDFRLLGA